ncbi:MAG: hypothetical protein Tsb0021_18470 [Chlamydiales bacterium]
MKVKKPTTNNEGPYRKGRPPPKTGYRVSGAKLLLLIVLGLIFGGVIKWWAWSWECALAQWPFNSMPLVSQGGAMVGMLTSIIVGVFVFFLFVEGVVNPKSWFWEVWKEPLIRRVEKRTGKDEVKPIDN